MPGKPSSSSFDRRDLLKVGLGASGLIAAGLHGGSVLAQDASPAASPAATPDAGPSQFTAADYQPAAEVEIEYWQYEYQTKVDLVNQLIPEFQQANPLIKIKHVNFPYDDFRTQVAAAVQAGEGPDVLNVYFGWIPSYVQQQFLIGLPADIFPTAQIEAAFFPTVQAAKVQDVYYALPTAVRTLAMFYNKDILSAAGLNPPTNWEEIVSVAQATAKKNGDSFEIVGITSDIDGQGHNWWREGLVRQNGGTPISEDNRTLNWTSPEAVEAFKFLASFQTDLGVTQAGFDTDGPTAFGNGHAALHVDGSYRVGTYQANNPDLNYGIVPLPAHKSQASFASFWSNTITRNAAEGDKMIAAVKWIDYLSSVDVQKRWTPAVGELPARVALSSDSTLMADEKLAPFIQSLPFSYATFMVNEADLRQAVMDAYAEVTLNGTDPQTALEDAQSKIQAEYDEYWSSIG